MKKTLLKNLAFLLLIAFASSCSNDESIINDTTSTDFGSPAARAGVWDGEIGIVDANGDAQITADTATLITELENMLDSEGITTTLQTIAIVEKKATNDLTNESYMLIASDNVGISVGLILKNSSNSLSPAVSSFGALSVVSCRGCASGCNLEYIYIDGKKYPYCDENGCGEFCSKKEITIK